MGGNSLDCTRNKYLPFGALFRVSNRGSIVVYVGLLITVRLKEIFFILALFGKHLFRILATVLYNLTHIFLTEIKKTSLIPMGRSVNP